MTEPLILVGELRTGQIETILPVSAQSWGLRYNDAGHISCALPLYSEEVSGWVEQLPAQLFGTPLNSLALGAPDPSPQVRRRRAIAVRQSTAPARKFLAVQYGRRILEAGPIWARDYDDDTGQLSLSAAGVWSYYDHRKVLPVLGGAEATEVVTKYAGQSLGDITRRLVALAHTHTGGTLPINLGVFDDSGDQERTYQGYDLSVTGEELRDLTGVEGGPDIRFDPRFDTEDPTKIVWDLRVGTPAEPLLHQSGADWVWDATRPKGSVTKISVKEDATNLAARAWVPGNGNERDMLLAVAEDFTLVDAGWPLLEVEEDHKTTERQTTLDGHAAELLGRNRRPWQTWSMNVRADESPAIGEYQVGDYATIFIRDDHPLLPSGPTRVRILSIDGDHTRQVKLGLAPFPSEV